MNIRVAGPAALDVVGGVVVVVDVFRAFSTACHILVEGPRSYALITNSASLDGTPPGALLVGKPELGVELSYDAPNSPTLAAQLPLAGRRVVHRTGAGARGVLAARGAELVLTGALVNASATARYIRDLAPQLVTIVAMGHEAGTRSLEDELCAECLRALILGEDWELTDDQRFALRSGPGKYFFEGAWEYPPEDFDLCLQRDVFDFALRAELFDDHARLHRVEAQ